jgi:regulator of Ty1 transposition protein 103
LNVKSAKPLSLRDEIANELTDSTEVPEPNELIQMLKDLEKSASSDAVIRERIAELPSNLSDINSLNALRNRSEAKSVSSDCADAIKLLDSYNDRLQQEIVNRKQTALSLASFINLHQQQAIKNKTTIAEWEQKMKEVEKVKKELHVHLQSLPDLSSIEKAAVHIPLPSPGDLFST